ncbi:hypothetical protein ACRE1S_01830 [Helicobacter himalayensis]|uniref:hypothetical protein n=1 Tax=Helicobacter himalayensis TaxID=1591088 RepID=UPI003D6DE605
MPRFLRKIASEVAMGEGKKARLCAWLLCGFCAVFLAQSALLADNFIIDTQKVREFELRLKQNQTLMIDYKNKKFLGILEALPNGSFKKLPIPKEWDSEDMQAVFRLKTYSDYDATTTNIGQSSMTTYKKNKDFPKDEDSLHSLKNPAQVKTPQISKPTQSVQIESEQAQRDSDPALQPAQNNAKISTNSKVSKKSTDSALQAKDATLLPTTTTHPKPTSTNKQNSHEWDKSKIPYEQESQSIEL